MRHGRVSDFLSECMRGIALVGISIAAFLGTPAFADGSGLRFGTGAEWRDTGLVEPTLRPLSPFYGSLAPTYENWRLNVRYALIDEPNSEFALGMTAQGRDDPDRPGRLGLAPATLLSARGEYRLGLKWSVAGSLEADARQTRNLDLGLRVAYAMTPAWSLSAGYRLLDQNVNDYEPGAAVVRGSWLTFGTRLRF